MEPFREVHNAMAAVIAQTVYQLATRCTVGGQVNRTRLYRPCSPPNLLYHVYRVIVWDKAAGTGC